jgi:hypothetical protein
MFYICGKTKHGRCEQRLMLYAALTADAADAIVPQKEEAQLGLSNYNRPLIFRDAAPRRTLKR